MQHHGTRRRGRIRTVFGIVCRKTDFIQRIIEGRLCGPKCRLQGPIGQVSKVSALNHQGSQTIEDLVPAFFGLELSKPWNTLISPEKPLHQGQGPVVSQMQASFPQKIDLVIGVVAAHDTAVVGGIEAGFRYR